MPTSQARIDANRRNAGLSSGPRTEEGKARSRGNALKHGLTGAGVVLPEADAAEVDRRSAAFAEELGATGEVGRALARRAALNSVRMERGADQQSAALADRVRRAEAEFAPPEGVDAIEADRLRAEAARRAMFDPSPEATLARRHEAAAERGFFRALQELRRRGRQAVVDSEAAQAAKVDAALGSFFEARKADRRSDAEFDALCLEIEASAPGRPPGPPRLPPAGGEIDVPFSIGRRR